MRNKGFTLIELVVVIVILGVLSVTAAPRFLNLQSDARVAVLKGVKGSLAGAAAIVYGKAAVQGKDTGRQLVDGIQTYNGHVEANSVSNVRMVLDTDLYITADTDGEFVTGILIHGYKDQADNEEAVKQRGCYLHVDNDWGDDENPKPSDGELIFDLVNTGC